MIHLLITKIKREQKLIRFQIQPNQSKYSIIECTQFPHLTSFDAIKTTPILFIAPHYPYANAPRTFA